MAFKQAVSSMALRLEYASWGDVELLSALALESGQDQSDAIVSQTNSTHPHWELSGKQHRGGPLIGSG